jgi:hypothetical protein
MCLTFSELPERSDGDRRVVGPDDFLARGTEHFVDGCLRSARLFARPFVLDPSRTSALAIVVSRFVVNLIRPTVETPAIHLAPGDEPGQLLDCPVRRLLY